MTQCPAVTMSTTRHNEVVRAVGQMMRAVGWDARSGENAAWFRKRPDLRPFDLLYRVDPSDKWTGIDVGIGDPTRFGSAPTGQHYLLSGQASTNLVQRKNNAFYNNLRLYGPLKAPTKFQPVGFEATGGQGVEARKLLRSIFAAAEEAKAKVPRSQWSWSAQTFSAHWQQRLSFEIAKYTAITVLLGARKIAAAEASCD